MAVQRRSTTDVAPEGDLPEDVDSPRSSTISRKGWGHAKKVKAAVGAGYAEDFKITEEETLIKFLDDDGPFFSNGKHWIDEIKDGQRSFFCSDSDCPLCAVGHKPRAEYYYNVAVLSDGKPEVRVLLAGPMLEKILEKDNDSKQGPLHRNYWSICKSVSGTGSKSRTSYHTKGYKDADLLDDWELEPAEVKALLPALKPYDEKIYRLPTVEELEEIRDDHLIDAA